MELEIYFYKNAVKGRFLTVFFVILVFLPPQEP